MIDKVFLLLLLLLLRVRRLLCHFVDSERSIWKWQLCVRRGREGREERSRTGGDSQKAARKRVGLSVVSQRHECQTSLDSDLSRWPLRCVWISWNNPIFSWIYTSYILACLLRKVPGSLSDLNTGNRIEGATGCPSWCRPLRPLFHFLCSNLKANPVHLTFIHLQLLDSILWKSEGFMVAEL